MKNTIITCLLAALAGIAQANAQQAQSFTLVGKLSGKPVDSARISYTDADGKYMQKTVPVTAQAFTYTGKIARPASAAILFKNKGEEIPRQALQDRTRQFYIDPGTVTISGDAADVAALKIKGAKTQGEYNELNGKIQVIRTEMKPLEQAFMAEKDHEKAAAIHEKFEPFNERMKKVYYDFFVSHPNSYITLDMMRFYVSRMKLDSVKRIYNGFSETFKNTNQGKELAGEIKKIEGGMPGSVAPLFTKTDIDGKTLSLADFKGKYVMLDFWASWCVPCRKGNPHMIEVYNKYKSKGLEIIGIADDDRALKVWHDAIEKDGVGIWRHVLRGLNMDMIMKRQPNPDDLDQAYGIASIPTKILIDPQGKIVGRYGDTFGGSDEDMDKMLASVFKD